jgi:DnaJ-class molecular chaperone
MSKKPLWVDVPCAFCHGTGIDPFGILSYKSTCSVCGGRRVVSVPAARMRCTHCSGTGAIKTFRCNVCGGKGWVDALPEPTRICPDCGGTGSESSNPALECLTCRGRGRVPGSRYALQAG